MAVAFDEMTGLEGGIRPAYSALSTWLHEVPPELLERRRREAELLFRRIGITFAVYGEADAQERLIPFDVIPRVLAAAEWARLESGLIQRVKAINLYINDIYGNREILRAGVVPEELVFQNPVFRPEMNGQKVPHDIYVHIAGIDVVRVDPDTFYVLEDNTRTPSGVSYMLENREIMLRLFPDLFARHRVAPVENYPDELLATLKSVAPPPRPADPTVVLLTPGVYNSAYYEHSFLADKLGVELVEGRDLLVKGDVVYMRTTEGLKRVDVIYRRIDDDFLDPLAFRPELDPRRARPRVGLPGRQRHARQRGRHRGCRRQGGVQLHAGYRPVLPGRGADPQERHHLALPRSGRARLYARPPGGAGGQGGARLGRLRHADRAEGGQDDDRGVSRQAQGRSEELHRPADAGAVDLPTCVAAGIAPRHVDLRPFVLTGRDRTRIVPGGLTRVALQEGSLVVNSSQGGGTKDTWVLDR